jgi:hypothetical protein
MHGREHVMVIRPGLKGLIAHTMFYVNEVRSAEEYAANVTDVGEKELDLAKRFVEAIADTFRPDRQVPGAAGSLDCIERTVCPIDGCRRRRNSTRTGRHHGRASQEPGDGQSGKGFAQAGGVRCRAGEKGRPEAQGLSLRFRR